MYHTNSDNEWIASVTVTMVAFAATAVGCFIELIYTALNPIAVLRCP